MAQSNIFLPLLPLVSQQENQQNEPSTPSAPKRAATSSTTTSMTTTPSLTTSSYASSIVSSPSEDKALIAYAIKKLVAPTTNTTTSTPNQREPETLGLYHTLDLANNIVYSLRLSYETCDPCFFWYGDGHGSPHPELSGPSQQKAQGEFLSWEVFPDHDGGEEKGCRVWVEKVEVNPWSDFSMDSIKESVVDVETKVVNWRDALEPIARPCDFWGTFQVK